MHNLTEDYIAAHTSREPDRLYRLYRRTNLRHVYGRMCSGHVQGRLLKMLTAMIRPGRILELGTFTGYSTLCLAEGMPPGASIHTVEIDDEWEDELLRTFSEAGHGTDITLHIGDAFDIVPTIDVVWDMVFIDANKRRYTDYYEMVLPRVRPGGFILADNTLWDGKVLQTPMPTDAQTVAIAEFNDMIARDPRVEVVMLPVRDGLTLIRKLP
ncbi:MAG: O-methyltransferase [Muribaculaceae bacterium]|nr:O-methyltransferase [Muribaculaceae bacterium]